MFVHWLKDLWKETWARYAVLIGFAGNVITFLFPGLRSNVLHIIVLTLLVFGFVWANFRVYEKLRSGLNAAHKALDGVTRGKPERNFNVSLSVVGVPPSPQFIRVVAAQTVSAAQLDYLLSDGSCIATDSFILEGETFDIPIENHQILKLWNTPRHDRSMWDGSGPAKFRITLSVNGQVSRYILTVRLESYLHGSTWYRKVIGSEVFHGPAGK